MASDVRLTLWDLTTVIGIFGFGMAGLRICRIKAAPLVVSGMFGVSLWIALGAWLNLFHLFRTGVFFALAGIGVLLAIVELVLVRRGSRAPKASTDAPKPFGLPAKLVLGVAVILTSLLALGGMRPQAWCVDDLEGYAALAVKAAQVHSIQPDPFCERRVQAGVGGGNFLDTLMYADGDLRAMSFIDSTFGLCLYALGLWAVGRRWKAPPMAIALAMLFLVFASLVKLNLTIVYLSVAGFFAVLLLLSEALPAGRIHYGRVVAVGIIVGSICSTKSPNITFVVPFLVFAALLHKRLQPAAKTLTACAISLLVALAVFAPWSFANKTAAGTYLYPLFGLGIHVSAFHFVPVPSAMAPLQLTLVVVAPAVIVLVLGAMAAWKLTSTWEPAARAAAVAYLLASVIAAPVIIRGVGGQSADRYTAPILNPALLLSLLIFAATWATASPAWRRLGLITQLGAWSYVFLLMNVMDGEYPHLKTTLAEGIGIHAKQPEWMRPLSGEDLQEQFTHWAKVQASIPPGATVLSATVLEYPFDFRRNTIYIADWPGMASPPPGLPLQAGPEEQRKFLVRAGIQYIILPAPVPPNPSPFLYFLDLAHRKYPWNFFLLHERSAHTFAGWEVVETLVVDRERGVWQQIVDHSPQVYNDGHVIVARIG